MNKGVILGGSLAWLAATAYMIWFLLTVSSDSPGWKWTLGAISGLIFVIGMILLAIAAIAAIVASRRESKIWEE
jgi:hypothetical protein